MLTPQFFHVLLSLATCLVPLTYVSNNWRPHRRDRPSVFGALLSVVISVVGVSSSFHLHLKSSLSSAFLK
ncbi:unnamed protein product [Lactuca virosa]|uniref:Uncharacterized protein n=1 Tax=Lactuca virosa TaxID=75947 RepID=A0AAU9MIG9_9ASTR|nr:unnamed protein product [Lactuca virosa]